jgi:hypothetical protein
MAVPYDAPNLATREVNPCLSPETRTEHSSISSASAPYPTEPFTDIFGPGPRRKAPRIYTDTSEELRTAVEGAEEFVTPPQSNSESGTSTRPVSADPWPGHRLVRHCAAHLPHTGFARDGVPLGGARYARGDRHGPVALPSARPSSTPRRSRACSGDGEILPDDTGLPPPRRRAGDRGRGAASRDASAFRSSCRHPRVPRR